MKCRFCDGESVTRVMDLGTSALAGEFLRPGDPEGGRHPLALDFCRECSALQLAHHVPAERLFRNYFYHSGVSRTMRRHFADYARVLATRFRPRTAVEIGCNDGTMMRELGALGVRVTGVDPSSVARAQRDLQIVPRFFDERLAHELAPVDIVIANNVFAHISEINDAVSGIRHLIGDTGVFVFEVGHLAHLLVSTQYDWIYHEHLYYHSVLALSTLFARHGLQIFDVEQLGVHGGSIRVFVGRPGLHPQTVRALEVLKREFHLRLNDEQTYLRFAQRARDHAQELRTLVEGLRAQGARIAGYGASGRANAVIAFAGIAGLEYLVDDDPAKQGCRAPGSLLPIYGPQALRERPVDYVLVFAWTFLEEIAARCSDLRAGMIVPFPQPRVIRAPVLSEAA